MAEWLMRRIANLNCVGSIPIRFSKEICRGCSTHPALHQNVMYNDDEKMMIEIARMAKLVYAHDSKSCSNECRFESDSGHQKRIVSGL